MIKPLGSNVVLKLEKEETVTKSGIILTEGSKEKPDFGIVYSIGPDVKSLKEEEKVIYKTYSGTKITLDEEDYLIIEEENILAVIK